MLAYFYRLTFVFKIKFVSKSPPGAEKSFKNKNNNNKDKSSSSFVNYISYQFT